MVFVHILFRLYRFVEKREVRENNCFDDILYYIIARSNRMKFIQTRLNRFEGVNQFE